MRSKSTQSFIVLLKGKVFSSTLSVYLDTARQLTKSGHCSEGKIRRELENSLEKNKKFPTSGEPAQQEAWGRGEGQQVTFVHKAEHFLI